MKLPWYKRGKRWRFDLYMKIIGWPRCLAFPIEDQTRFCKRRYGHRLWHRSSRQGYWHWLRYSVRLKWNPRQKPVRWWPQAHELPVLSKKEREAARKEWEQLMKGSPYGN